MLRHAANRPRSDGGVEVNEVVVDELYDMRVIVSLLLHALVYGDIQTGQSTKLNYIPSN